MIEKIKQLVDKLNKARKAYYQESYEIMSDFEYDKLYDELEALENKTGIVLSNSPTQQVGYIVLSELKKVKHNKKMLSLDKTKEISKIEDFLDVNEGLLSFKMDGLTIVLTYTNGTLVSAVTRGNGEIGEDITHNCKVFKNIPLKIPYKDELVIRGEALISFKDFETINENLDIEEKYKNPRNLCSGTVRQLNNEITKDRNVSFLAFSLVKCDKSFKLKSEQLDYLKSLGFETVEYTLVNKSNVAKAITDFENRIETNKFTTDGLVVTFNDISYSNSLGETSKFPKDSIAFKWADDLATTTLLNVEWNTSRTGLINPVAIFEPVELEGTTVNRASLHNISIIKNLKLGIGDTIKVYKANMIIPQVAENITNSDNLKIPDKCNACGCKAEPVQIRDGLALKCTNPSCIAKIINGIVHYVSRDAMNITDFSKATIEKFINNKFITNYADIYTLENFKENIVNMQGFGEKSYNNLINAIEKSKNTTLANFIYSLGIEHIGLSNAKILCKYFNYNFDKIKNATLDEIILIDGFGEIMANSLINYFSNKENISLINKVFPLLKLTDNNNTISNKSIQDKTFVITGDLQSFKNRKELQQKIEDLGGKVTGSVSAKTDYLINNDKNSTSSKNKKAKELNIPIISEDDFLTMLEA
ncbi:NAD-dependent DNA ligase LigA [uncultured Tyzzerella sp.]|uniref:NAD-dependent DNA ligase LigA n=1 Tax=uncultured Tyzzerella sp. TaxID=2321398 RepID=UPI002941ECF1|nr:NAD-dependent DNA ligase LigA [uncultured Tyzzerella sp.]